MSDVHCELNELLAFKNKLEGMVAQGSIDQLCVECTKELAARVLSKTIRRTPVGKYQGRIKRYKRTNKNHKAGEAMRNKNGKERRHAAAKVGGTLRRGWSVGQGANSMQVVRTGSQFALSIINPVEYASYVEYGHRTRNHKGWVPGRFMMTISAKEVEQAAPAIIERKLEAFLEEVFGE